MTEEEAIASANARGAWAGMNPPKLATAFLDGRVVLHAGDCRDVIRGLADASIDSVVSDPPYALVSIQKRFGKVGSAAAKGGVYARAAAGFMGKQWDTGEAAFAAEFWAEVLRVLKPGGHLLAFSGTRTYHRLASAIEDAGFEIRDQIGWAYGSGFPKSHDVSKGIDKRRDDRDDILRVTTAIADAADGTGVSRAEIDQHMGTSDMGGWWASRLRHRCACPTWDQWMQLKALLHMGDELDAEVWRLNGRKGTPGEAWQTAEVVGHHDKDAHAAEWRSNYTGSPSESDRAIRAANSEASRQWEGWGTALKPAWEPIVMARKPLAGTVAENVLEHGTGALNIDGTRIHADDAKGYAYSVQRTAPGAVQNATGERKLDGVTYEGQTKDGRWPANIIHDGSDEVVAAFPSEAGAFAPVRGTEPSNAVTNVYGARERTATTHHGDTGSAARFFYTAKADADDRLGSKHPTVKPLDLMQYLVRLVTPPGGTVLDPFAGTGTTGEAAWREGMRAILIEREPEYQADIARRMDLAEKPTKRAAVAKSKNNLQGAEGTPLFGGEAA